MVEYNMEYITPVNKMDMQPMKDRMEYLINNTFNVSIFSILFLSSIGKNNCFIFTMKITLFIFQKPHSNNGVFMYTVSRTKNTMYFYN